MNPIPPNHDSRSRPTAKKSYRASKLMIYGDIRQITQTTVPSGTMNDMGGGSDETAAG